MPIIASAKKKLRQDVKRAEVNIATRNALKASLRLLKKKPSKEGANAAYKAVDTAAKKHIIHKNTAGRLKSQVARLVATPKSTTATA
jgi:ribosomal protein S20